MSRLEGEPAELENLIAEVTGVIADYEALALRHGAGRVELFGTEAIRRLVASGQAASSPVLSRVRVLSSDEEAQCSAFAALAAAPEPVTGSVLVIDQGGGSVEVVEALAGKRVTIARAESLSLGADALLKRWRAKGKNLTTLKHDIADAIGDRQSSTQFVTAFGLGSVATKCGWLFSNPPTNSRYSPQRAHGAKITIQQLRGMVEAFSLTPYPQWDSWRARFDPANPTSDDLERVVTGTVLLLLLLEKHGVDHFIVSTMGSRHGLLLSLGQRAS